MQSRLPTLLVGLLLTLASTCNARVPGREVIAFQVNKTNWPFYDWRAISTLVLYNGLDPAMLPVAKQYDVTVVWPVVFSASFLDANTSTKAAWIVKEVEKVVQTNTDGINIDFEEAVAANSTQQLALTELLTALGSRLRERLVAVGRKPHYSIDVAWSAKGIDGRFYDYASLGAIFDYSVIMDYDVRSQVFGGGPCLAGPNADRSTMLAGIQSYLDLGIPASKLVLGTPWYGYDYTCVGGAVASDPSIVGGECVIKEVPFRGCNCSDAAGRQFNVNELARWAAGQIEPAVTPTTAVFTNATSLSVTWNYRDYGNAVHQVWSDNADTLGAKWGIAAELALGGVSMWNVDAIRPFANNTVVDTQMLRIWQNLAQYLQGSIPAPV